MSQDDALQTVPGELAIAETLVSRDELRHRVANLGEEISEDYNGHHLLIVVLLKGAVVFFADLVRYLSTPCEVDFMVVSSYGSQATSSGVVSVLKDLNVSIEDRHVLIVEDIVESGVTLSYVMRSLEMRSPSSLEACVLLAKPDCLRVELRLRYVGFCIPDRFAVGYGLDYAQHFRNLDHVAALDVP